MMGKHDTGALNKPSVRSLWWLEALPVIQSTHKAVVLGCMDTGQLVGVIQHFLRFSKMFILLPIRYIFIWVHFQNIIGAHKINIFLKIWNYLPFISKNNHKKENFKKIDFFKAPNEAKWFLTWSKGKKLSFSSFLAKVQSNISKLNFGIGIK